MEVEQMVQMHPEVRLELEKINNAFEQYALAHAKTPPAATKPFVLAIIDYSERVKKGEKPVSPPALHTGSLATDYSQWLDRPDLAAPSPLGDLHARIIGYSPSMTTAIVWIRHMAPPEVHNNEYERFLILEGSCDIQIGSELHKLSAGDFLSIPLHVSHHLRVTSARCRLKSVDTKTHFSVFQGMPQSSDKSKILLHFLFLLKDNFLNARRNISIRFQNGIVYFHCGQLFQFACIYNSFTLLSNKCSAQVPPDFTNFSGGAGLLPGGPT
jgi:mannose-6-phosphate isomerase-like protein (cupin superfamily)